MPFKKVQRKVAKLRAACTGPSGSGKTLSSLYLAFGFTNNTTKHAMILQIIAMKIVLCLFIKNYPFRLTFFDLSIFNNVTKFFALLQLLKLLEIPIYNFMGIV